MMASSITIAPATLSQLSAIVDLIMAQEARLSALNPQLTPPHTRDQLTDTMRLQLTTNEHSLVALDIQNHVRGYMDISYWDLPTESMLQAFLTARNGIVRSLTLPDPDDKDAFVVLDTLLHTLTSIWRQYQTTGDLLRWPSDDFWLVPLLQQHGFQVDSVAAMHASPPRRSSSPPKNLSRLQIRLAQSEDEEALVELLREELLFHTAYTPFVRFNAGVERTFRGQLQRCWHKLMLQEGAPLIMVMEQQDKIVAMAHGSLLTVAANDEPGFTPPGLYGCIDNMSVHPTMRRQGIGHALVEAMLKAFAAAHLPLDGYVLWYNPANPAATYFWSRQQFAPLWTTYQRMQPLPGDVPLHVDKQ